MSQIDCNDFIEILAFDVETVGNQTIKSFGVNELISKTLYRCKQALNGDMRSVMTNQISKTIERNLINENAKIRNYIYEKIILNFTKGYENQNDENFKKSIVILYEYNIHYFLNKKIGEQTISLIKNGDIVRNSTANFINYYHQKVNSMISNELKSLAYDLLDIQSIKEQQAGKSTLIQNKRNGKEFIISIQDFLNNNFNCLAQKYYIAKFMEKTSDSLTKTFEDILNNITSDLLKQNDIKKLIDECFLKKYQEFEEKMTKINTKIVLRQNTLKDSVSNNNSNYPKFQKNSNLTNNTPKNILSDKQSITTNTPKNILSDIQSVTTIPLPMNKDNSSPFSSSNNHQKSNKKY